MTIEVNYADAYANLAALLDQIADDREMVIIHRGEGKWFSRQIGDGMRKPVYL